MKKATFLIVVILLIGLGLGIYYFQKNYSPTLNNPTSETLTIENEQEYLNKIFNYIDENKIDISPAIKENYKIENITEGELEGENVTMIHLNCCYMGDIAYMNKDGEIIEFHLGDQ